MNIQKELLKITPHPRKAISDIPIGEICNILDELNRKLEAIEDRLEELE